MDLTELVVGRRVRVYFNLRKRVLSVMDAKTRKVIAHTGSISLENVRFLVSQAGLIRVRREQRKQVIAFIEGNIVASCTDATNEGWQQAYFNPYKVDHFMIGENPVHEASQCRIANKTVMVKQEVAHGCCV